MLRIALISSLAYFAVFICLRFLDTARVGAIKRQRHHDPIDYRNRLPSTSFRRDRLWLRRRCPTAILWNMMLPNDNWFSNLTDWLTLTTTTMMIMISSYSWCSTIRRPLSFRAVTRRPRHLCIIPVYCPRSTATDCQLIPTHRSDVRGYVVMSNAPS